MYCPNDQCPDFLNTGLRAEYRDDITACPYCETPLVGFPPENPTAKGDDDRKPRVADDEVLEPVIETTDPSEVAIIKSILDGAGIPFLTRGENRFSAFPGALAGGSILNPRNRGVVFLVPARMTEEALNLLDELIDRPEDIDDDGTGAP